jgi:hypothetical protein
MSQATDLLLNLPPGVFTTGIVALVAAVAGIAVVYRLKKRKDKKQKMQESTPLISTP